MFTGRFLSVIGLSVLLMAALPPSVAQAGIYDISSAINKAGRQRMLSQRIVATYCQVGMDLQSKKSKRQLKDAVALFDEQLAELKAYRDSGRIGKQLARAEKAWLPLKTIAVNPVTRDRAEELRQLAEDVLRESHRVVILLQDESGSKKGRLVNISGRQRMLSQRLSSLYMLQSWGFSSSEYTDDYSRAMNEFKGALNELMSSPLNTDEINALLNKAQREFHMFERSAHHKTGEYIPLMVKMSADKLLGIMNETTSLYEKLEQAN